jgi:putative oxidoreductase
MNRDKLQSIALNSLRIVTGFLFFQHGLPKLVGFPTGAEPATPFTQFWLAGILEVFGGLLIVVGLFVQPVAFILSGEMAVAYFQAHFPRGLWPIGNGGELAALYCFVFLYLAVKGGGDFSLDGLRSGRRR